MTLSTDTAYSAGNLACQRVTTIQLNMILAQAKRNVEAGALPREVSAELCKTYGLNWMFIAPMVQAFKK